MLPLDTTSIGAAAPHGSGDFIGIIVLLDAGNGVTPIIIVVIIAADKMAFNFLRIKFSFLNSYNIFTHFAVPLNLCLYDQAL